MSRVVASSGVLVALIGLTGLTGCKHSQPEQKTKAVTSAAVVAQSVRVGDASSRVNVTGSIVALQDVALSAKQGGRITEVTVREGDVVTAGQILARIDATDLISQVRSDQAAVDSAKAKLSQAQAAYDQQLTTTETSIASARAAYTQQVATTTATIRFSEASLASAKAALSAKKEGDRPEERTQKQASLASAQANYKKAQADLSRYEKLHAAGAISDADLDNYRNTRDVAQADLRSAEAAVQLQEKGNRSQDIDQAEQSVREAEQNLRQSQAGRLADTAKKSALDEAIAGRAQNEVKQADVKAAQAALEQAQTALQIAEQAVADTVVHAPIAGRISARSAEPGQVVASSTTLLHLITLDSVYFEPSVPNTALGQVSVGQPVDVTVDSFPGKKFPGKVTKIYPSGSATSRSFPIRITLANAAGSLRPQMFASGTIKTRVHRNVVLVPRGALIIDDATSDKARIFTVENNVAHEHSVTLGLTSLDGNGIEVSGLTSGSQVVTTGQSAIQEGQAVTMIPDASSKVAFQ